MTLLPQRLRTPLKTAGLALAIALPAAAQAQETVIVGETTKPAVEVNLGVLDSLAPAPASPYPTLDEPAVSANQGSVLLIAPSDGYAPNLVAPASGSDTFAMPSASAETPPLPEASPDPDGALAPEVVRTTATETAETTAATVEETVVEETMVAEPEVAEPVVDEPMAEETVVEETVVKEAEPTELIAAATTADSAAGDLGGDDSDPFAEIEEMLSEAEQADEVVVPEPETTVEETVVAAAPSETEEPVEETLQLLFQPGEEALSENDKAALTALAGDLASDENQRIQLRAYASAEDGTSSMARRLALSRALEVRKFLIDNGVRSTRIDVRALGDNAESGPLDRIDIVLVER
ncbi:MAG: OmpA family protein [Pseudomonadota bacterium]